MSESKLIRGPVVVVSIVLFWLPVIAVVLGAVTGKWYEAMIGVAVPVGVVALVALSAWLTVATGNVSSEL